MSLIDEVRPRPRADLDRARRGARAGAEQTEHLTTEPATHDPRADRAGTAQSLHRLLDGYIEAGLTKFVIRPAGRQTFDEFLDRFIAELRPRQN